MEIQKQAEMLQALLATDPGCGEIHLIFHLRKENCVATVELFWSADERDRRYVGIDFDMRRDWTLPM
jgi:hypothetical protein